MALAAVCPSCSTRFRVVADQLKLRNGWVRCGSCGFAFNAVERLSYVPDDTIVMRRSALDELIAKTKQEESISTPASPAAAPPPAGAQSAGRSIESAIEAREKAAALSWPALKPESEESAEPAAAPPAPQAQDVSATTAAPTAPAKETGKSRRRNNEPPEADDAYELHTIIELSPRSDAMDDPGLNLPDPAKELAAEFLQRDAQLAQRARRFTRWATAGSVLLALLLGGQLALAFRNELAVAAPGTQPVLQMACEHVGCSIELPAHASRLSLESLQLAQVGQSDVYQATVLVKNTSTLPQRAPHLELTLTRVNGDILTRRVLTPTEWLPAKTLAGGLPPQGETVAQFVLRVDASGLGGTLSGFFGTLFYPSP
jgi:predicted Zn finger-like uncharacterized protein